MNRREGSQNAPLNTQLISGRDYPGSEQELVTMFANPSACFAFIEKLRWPNGYICSSCGEKCEPWRQTRWRLVCPRCRHQGSATAGTLLEKTRVPLLIWMRIAWYLISSEEEISVGALSKSLGISKRSIPGIIQKFIIAMNRADRTQLGGSVYVGPEIGCGVGGYLAIELSDRKLVARVRVIDINGPQEESILLGVRKTIALGSTVFIRGQGFGEELNSLGYSHRELTVDDFREPYANNMIQIRKINIVLKTRYNIVSHPVKAVYLFNRRSITTPGIQFRTLINDLLTSPDL